MYVGRCKGWDTIIEYIVPSEKSLHIYQGYCECCYKHYDVLTTEDQNGIKWSVYSNGKVPPNAVIGNKRLDRLYRWYICCTVTGSDISTATTCKEVPINLPHENVANTQLFGKIHPSHRCMYDPWDGKEYIYQSYEVLMASRSPKSLQHLCRNVIITVTMGVSNRIDQLPLPVTLKKWRCLIILYIGCYITPTPLGVFLCTIRVFLSKLVETHNQK